MALTDEFVFKARAMLDGNPQGLYLTYHMHTRVYCVARAEGVQEVVLLKFPQEAVEDNPDECLEDISLLF